MPTKQLFRAVSFVAIAYAVAIFAAGATLRLMPSSHPILRAALADVVATVAVFGFSRAFDNSSFYDPYWSVAPMVMAPYLAFAEYAHDGISVRKWLAILVVFVWGGRLSYNWLRGWRGLGHEDWRYVDLRNRLGRAYWPVSFLGIHLMPTVCTFVGSLALFPIMRSARPMGWLDGVGVAIALGAASIESIADRQLHDHRQRREAGTEGDICESGLWRYSRHPNYFGECMFWVGLFIIGVSAEPTAVSWTIAGPIVMFVLFVFISIPMMERRSLAKRPHFASHQHRVSRLIPWFRKS